MLQTFTEIFQFIKAPQCGIYENYTIQQKFRIILHLLALALILAVISIIPMSIIGELGLVDMDNHANAELFEKFSPIVVLFLVTIIAPLFEELIFRAPITLFCHYKKQFKFIFYGFAIAFGYVHIFNFDMTTNVLLLSPLLVLPQIMLGLLLGFTRLKLGLLYAMLLHGLYNGILTLPLLLFGDLISV